MLAQLLDEQLKEVAPIYGVSIGKENDKSTWEINFKDEATESERDAAQVVIDNFDKAESDKEDGKLEIKTQANQDILSLYSIWKQRNMIAEGLLELISFLIDKGVFTQAELEARPKAAELLDAWDKVTAIRTQSDTDEAKL